jgi:hypothetical protein
MTVDRSPKIPFKEDYKAVITANKPIFRKIKFLKNIKVSEVLFLKKQSIPIFPKFRRQEQKDIKIKTETGHSFLRLVLHFM